MEENLFNSNSPLSDIDVGMRALKSSQEPEIQDQGDAKNIPIESGGDDARVADLTQKDEESALLDARPVPDNLAVDPLNSQRTSRCSGMNSMIRQYSCQFCNRKARASEGNFSLDDNISCMVKPINLGICEN